MQFFAHEFQKQSALGERFQHLYAPWSILHWAIKWHGVYPEALLRSRVYVAIPTHRAKARLTRSSKSSSSRPMV
jgi:hypothetical protein